MFRVSCQLSSWLGSRAEDEEFEILPEADFEEYSNDFLLISKWPGTESHLISSRVAAVVLSSTEEAYSDADELSKQLAGHHVLHIDMEAVRTSYREVKDIETVASLY